MSRTLTPFEKNLKQKMAHHEAPYEASDWADLSSRLGSSKAITNQVWAVALVASLLVVGAGAFAFYRIQFVGAKAIMGTIKPRFVSDEIIIFSSIDQNNQSNDTTTGLSQVGATKNRVGSNTKNSPVVSTSSVDIDSNSTAGRIKQTETNTKQADHIRTTDIKGGSRAANTVAFSANVSQACQGVEVEFGVDNGPKQGSYLWNFGDGHFSSDINPKHKYAKPGTYDVSLSITSNQGQISTTVMADMITIHPAPTANFKWEFINESPETPVLKMLNSSDYASNYQWKFADGNISKEVSPTLNLTNKGKQMVSLLVTNEYGCSDASLKTIYVNSDMNFGAPVELNAGKETFMPTALKDNKVKFELFIYDLSGNLIHKTNNRTKGWDGKLSDGTLAKSGTKFSWKAIVVNDSSKDEKYYNGTLTIIP